MYWECNISNDTILSKFHVLSNTDHNENSLRSSNASGKWIYQSPLITPKVSDNISHFALVSKNDTDIPFALIASIRFPPPLMFCHWQGRMLLRSSKKFIYIQIPIFFFKNLYSHNALTIQSIEDNNGLRHPNWNPRWKAGKKKD